MAKRMAALAVAVLMGFFSLSVTSAGADLKPLSASDKARVDKLLRSFDPNSYDIRYQYVDKGKVKSVHEGRAVGLSSLKQSNTMRMGTKNVAPRSAINVFRSAASTNATINVFRQFARMPPPVRARMNVPQSAQELNSILAKYYK
jgi:hypothetical protein